MPRSTSQELRPKGSEGGGPGPDAAAPFASVDPRGCLDPFGHRWIYPDPGGTLLGKQFHDYKQHEMLLGK